jgi:hypothetical protein
VFGIDQEVWKSSYDNSELLRKFNMYKDTLSKFLDEDKLLNDGIKKTSDTSQTFDNILRYHFYNLGPPRTKRNVGTSS